MQGAGLCLQHFVYLEETASLDTAERFLSNAEASFNDLAAQPMIGASLILRHPDRRMGSRSPSRPRSVGPPSGGSGEA